MSELIPWRPLSQLPRAERRLLLFVVVAIGIVSWVLADPITDLLRRMLPLDKDALAQALSHQLSHGSEDNPKVELTENGKNCFTGIVELADGGKYEIEVELQGKHITYMGERYGKTFTGSFPAPPLKASSYIWGESVAPDLPLLLLILCIPLLLGAASTIYLWLSGRPLKNRLWGKPQTWRHWAGSALFSFMMALMSIGIARPSFAVLFSLFSALQIVGMVRAFRQQRGLPDELSL
jgi:hypothetical protein